jgi:predicted phosphodiesterase
MRILLLADIHGNFPALEAIDSFFKDTEFDHIVNCGDSVVYAPFANEVIQWLIEHKAVSILGNTDKKVNTLLQGKSFNKPSKPEKRIMYSHTAEQLRPENSRYLLSLTTSSEIQLFQRAGSSGSRQHLLGIFHGSPAKPHEFLFDSTPSARFHELAEQFPYKIIVTGHSHSPYHFEVSSTHFINPGSAGRMFDGNPAASCAILHIAGEDISVDHFRISYDVGRVIDELQRQNLPPIYQTMYKTGKKLN